MRKLNTDCKICGGKTNILMERLSDDRHGYPGFFTVRRCRECGFGQTFPQLKKTMISEIYQKYYPWKMTNLSRIDFEKKPPSRVQIWIKGLGFNCHYWIGNSGRVLDIGCGIGTSLIELINAGYDAYGIDPEPTAKKIAKRAGFKFAKGFLDKNQFGNTKFDYILASQVLEHENDPVKFLKLAKARLEPKGKIIVSFPNLDGWGRKIWQNKWLNWHVPYHLNHFTKESCKILAEKSGLKIEKLITISPNMWTNLQLRRLFQKEIPGKRDDLWDGNKTGNTTMELQVLKLGWNLLEQFNLLNRVPDVFGMGDCWLMILRK